MSELDDLATFDDAVAPVKAPPAVTVKDEEVPVASVVAEDQQEAAEQVASGETMDSPFTYFRYYVGHVGRHGNEFLEFHIDSKGLLKYANNSNYRKDSIIKKQCQVSGAVLREIKRMIIASRILDCDDSSWPEPDRNGRQEIEVHVGNTHISFVTNKITLFEEVESSNDPQGLEAFYFLVRDMKALVLSLVGLHFKIKAV